MARTMMPVLLCALVGLAVAAEEFSPTQLKLFTDGGLYLDKYEMGLYPGGKNDIPEAHRKAGLAIAASICPLDADGKPDDARGRVVALVMGHSNCAMYFNAVEAQLRDKGAELHPRFQLMNAAVGGQQLPELCQLRGPVWDKASRLLQPPGHSPLQVQVLFLHTTYHGAGNGGKRRPGRSPETMQKMRDDLIVLLEHCVKTYPNLKIAYITCDGLRHFSNFEPHVWQEAFAFKWLIESQIKGEDGTAFQDKDGKPRRLPWLCWGPYIWDNTWDRSFFTDGVHPAPKARAIFVNKYWEHLKADPVAQGWMFKP